jgi:hypothetical protein
VGATFANAQDQDNPKANSRNVINAWDFPFTAAIRRRLQAYDLLDASVDLEPILKRFVENPPVTLAYIWQK